MEFTAAERAHAERVVAIVGPVAGALAKALGPRTEVVLHDLTKLPGSIAAIGNPITGRGVGGPATDLGLRVFRSGWSEDLIGYRTETEDGLVMRSSSIFFRAASGRPVACLCLNTDIDLLVGAQEVLSALTAAVPMDPTADPPLDASGETFALSIDELAEGILRDTISAIGVPVHLMKKAQKVEVVRELDKRGFFTMREAADLIAQRLKVSRITVYNYLNEVQGKPGGDA
ncbi:transcriptional regulator [Amycolatopsis sp. NPDC098790]|uniref:helix-turn-helix transcriptional regulator n=1 Tax=Amycolatopsis sp. NPDC098790 TaxID=3363939 RepID=UPI0038277EC1